MIGPEEQVFYKMIRIAEGLPWSNRERLYSGLSRLVLEHIMATSISKEIAKHAPDRGLSLEVDLKTKVRLSIAQLVKSSHVSLKYAGNLVDLYVQSWSRKSTRKAVTSSGTVCNWIMGCPAAENPGMQTTAFAPFASLENDHIFPAARRGGFVEAGPAKKLCRYHNVFWKGQHIALALDRSWLS